MMVHREGAGIRICRELYCWEARPVMRGLKGRAGTIEPRREMIRGDEDQEERKKEEKEERKKERGKFYLCEQTQDTLH